MSKNRTFLQLVNLVKAATDPSDVFHRQARWNLWDDAGLEIKNAAFEDWPGWQTKKAIEVLQARYSKTGKVNPRFLEPFVGNRVCLSSSHDEKALRLWLDIFDQRVDQNNESIRFKETDYKAVYLSPREAFRLGCELIRRAIANGVRSEYEGCFDDLRGLLK